MCATSIQLAVHFAPTRLLLSSTSTVAGSAFTASTLETIDITNGTLKLKLSAPSGSSTQIVPVTFAVAGAVGSGTATGVQVPVAAGYSCVSVKDTVHSITKTAVPTISGARHSASMLLRQGDSNDDDIVDIVDFGLFLADRGTGKAPEARSNFNSDAHVGTGDFSFLTLSFFRAGESCTGALDGVRPRTRVSAKDLRRAGLGDAAAGDVNHDGWVDMRDVQSVLQGIDAAQAEQDSGGAPPRW